MENNVADENCIFKFLINFQTTEKKFIQNHDKIHESIALKIHKKKQAFAAE